MSSTIQRGRPTQTTGIDAALALISLLLLGMLFYGPWQDLCTAYARQVAFEQRDKLFDKAMRGEIEFADPAYRKVRTSIEQLIRFAHELSLLSFLMFKWRRQATHQPRGPSELTVALRSIKDEKVRRDITVLTWKAHYAMVLMMLAKSPVSVLFVFGLLIVRHITHTVPKSMTRYARPAGEIIQIEAETAFIDDRGFAKAA